MNTSTKKNAGIGEYLDFIELCHPLPLAALGLLLLNDHILKGAGLLPGALTGKLSDIAGLFFFPILLFACLRLIWRVATNHSTEPRPPFPYMRYSWGAAFLSALGFASVKLSPGINQWVEHWWGVMVMDPSDLICLPICALSAIWLVSQYRKRAARESSRLKIRNVKRTNSLLRSRPMQCGAALLAAAASFATAPPTTSVRNYPAWQPVEGHELELHDLHLDMWVAKSAKSGVGALIEFKNTSGTTRHIEITRAQLHLRKPSSDEVSQIIDMDRAPPTFTVAPESSEQIYVPIVFENEKAWNEGKRRGYFLFEIKIDDAEAIQWKIDAAHRQDTRYLTLEPGETAPPTIIPRNEPPGGATGGPSED